MPRYPQWPGFDGVPVVDLHEKRLELYFFRLVHTRMVSNFWLTMSETTPGY